MSNPSPPHGLHDLTVLDDETIEWLFNTCPEISCGQAVVWTTSKRKRRKIRTSVWKQNTIIWRCTKGKHRLKAVVHCWCEVPLTIRKAKKKQDCIGRDILQQVQHRNTFGGWLKTKQVTEDLCNACIRLQRRQRTFHTRVTPASTTDQLTLFQAVNMIRREKNRMHETRHENEVKLTVNKVTLKFTSNSNYHRCYTESNKLVLKYCCSWQMSHIFNNNNSLRTLKLFDKRTIDFRLCFS